jgi:hypothetical protein
MVPTMTLSPSSEKGQVRPTGVQIDITGTDGFLRITNEHALQKPNDDTIQAAVTGAGRRCPRWPSPRSTDRFPNRTSTRVQPTLSTSTRPTPMTRRTTLVRRQASKTPYGNTKCSIG